MSRSYYQSNEWRAAGAIARSPIFKAAALDRWTVDWYPHRPDIDIFHDWPGRRFMLRAIVTRENVEHLQGVLACMAGTLALNNRAPANPFVWPELENTWGTP